MKKVVLILIVLTVVFIAGCDNSLDNSYVRSAWRGTDLSYRVTDSGWSVAATALHGYSVRNLDFDAGSFGALRVTSVNDGGGVYLVITQDVDGTVLLEEIDLTGGFAGSVDTSGFAPGRVEMRLRFERATDVRVSIEW